MKLIFKRNIKKVKISVVIPLFNKALYIERALHSILAQTITDFELIVIDDGSTDGGCNIVKNLNGDRIRLIQQENSGVSAARNQGIVEAKGELIAFLDADDEWLPEFLETVIRLRDRYPEAGAFATAYQVDKGGGLMRNRKIRGYRKNQWEGIIPNYFKTRTTLVCSSAVAVKKEVFEKTGTFRVEAKRAEDLDLWLRIATYFAIAYSNKPQAIWYHGLPNNACLVGLPEINSPLEKSLSFIEKDTEVSTETKRQVRLYVSRHRLKDVKEFYLNGRYHIAKDIINAYKTNYGIGPGWLLCLLMLCSPLWVCRLVHKCRLKAVRFVLRVMKLTKELLLFAQLTHEK